MTVEKISTRPFKKYELPPLPYAADALEPQISKEQLSIHHVALVVSVVVDGELLL